MRYEQNEKNSVFYKRMLDRHDSIPQDINVDTLAMFSGDAMLRQVTEAVFINEMNSTLNMKEQWGNSSKSRERRNVFEFIDFANLNLRTVQERNVRENQTFLLKKPPRGGGNFEKNKNV